MRLSATDRIIREAQHDSDAVEAAEDAHPDTERVTAAPPFSLGYPSPRMPTLLGDEDDDDDEPYEEGKTQVDARRSAAALDQMRALQEGILTPPPAAARPAGPLRGVPPGRPGGTATMMFGGMAARPDAPAPAAVRVAVPFTEPTPAPVRALPSLVQPVAQPDNVLAQRRQAANGASGSLRTPTPSPVATLARPAPGAVGRGTGLAIAGLTAVAVAVILGSWTARRPLPAAAPLVLSPPERPAVPAAPADSPSPSAAVAPVAMVPPPPPAAVPIAPPPVAPAAETVPSSDPATAPPVADSTETGAASASSAKRARSATRSAKVAKARPAKKKEPATRRNQRVSRPARSAVRAAPGRSSGSQPAGRRQTDPDDTLPISD
jgi:hypothetical protein